MESEHYFTTGGVLEGKLEAQLDDAGVAGAYDLAEMDGIEERRCADLVKIGVIEDVGGFGAELNG